MANENKVLSLNKKFYELSAVKDGAEDFKDICSIRIKDNSSFINIEITTKIGSNKDTGYDQSVISGEFLNYVLGLMKNKSIV